MGFGPIEMSVELNSDCYLYGQMSEVWMAPYGPATQQVAGPRQLMFEGSGSPIST